MLKLEIEHHRRPPFTWRAAVVSLRRAVRPLGVGKDGRAIVLVRDDNRHEAHFLALSPVVGQTARTHRLESFDTSS